MKRRTLVAALAYRHGRRRAGLRQEGRAAPGPVSRGYTIPLIDLAADASRRTVVDREPGQYLGHPTTVLLEDGRTMSPSIPRATAAAPIVLKRSGDGGLTWSGRLPVPENWATSLETPTIHRVVGPDGTKRLIVWSGLYPARLAVSERRRGDMDAARAGRGLGRHRGHVGARRAAGRSAAAATWPCSTTTAAFSPKRPAQEKPPRLHPLCDVLRGRGPDLVLPAGGPRGVRGPSLRAGDRPLARRPDAGRAPAREQPDPQLVTSSSRKTRARPGLRRASCRARSPGTATPAKYAPDGRLFISFRDMTHDSPTHGDWVAWVGTFDDIVKGREGQYRVRLMDNTKDADCAYPGVEVLPDGTFVADDLRSLDVRRTALHRQRAAQARRARPPRPLIPGGAGIGRPVPFRLQWRRRSRDETRTPSSSPSREHGRRRGRAVRRRFAGPGIRDRRRSSSGPSV